MIRRLSIGRFALLALLPVAVVEAVWLPFWLARTYLTHPLLPIIALLLTGAVLPLYLAHIGTSFAWPSVRTRAFPALAILAFSALFAVFLHYLVWGISSGRLLRPDTETVMLMTFLAQVAACVALIPCALALLCRYAYISRHHGT